MGEEKFRLAGWAALISAFTFIFSTGLLLYYDVLYQPALGGGASDLKTLLIALFANIIFSICSIYAMLKFRQLLHERYDFHAVDNLILFLIFGGILLSALSYSARILSGNLVLISVGIFTLVLVGAIGIVFALRLLKTPGSLNGYLKPLAYTQLIESICFVLIILAPVGLMMIVIFNVLLGLVFLSRDTSLEEVDFV
jgi:hypothetical protein